MHAVLVLTCQNMADRAKGRAVGKRPAAAPPAPAATRGRGGGGRGAGRKATGVNKPGVDSDDAPKRKQLGLGDLLGERFAKKAKHGAEGAAGSDEQSESRWLHYHL